MKFSTFSHSLKSLSKIALSLLLAGVLSSGLAMAAGQPTKINGRLDFTEDAYRINVGDVLSINVYNQSDLSSTSILVRADGNASFNGIGEVRTAGKTLREASMMIEERLRDLIRDPHVSLTISESKPLSVYLAGAVMRPGTLHTGSSGSGQSASGGDSDGAKSTGVSNTPLSRMDFRLSSVLSAAGGVRLNADLANITISRDGSPYRTVNLWGMLKKGDTSEDIMLQNGDSIYIPELPEQALDDTTYRLLLSSSLGPRTFPVRVIGEVKQPGMYELNGTSPFLATAIARGGGFVEGSNRKAVAIRRFSAESKFSTLFVNPNETDFMLRPNDVVYIAELKSTHVGRFMESATRILAPFNSISSTAFSFALMKSYY
jgi:polysaccharide biosynthesis/export protein